MAAIAIAIGCNFQAPNGTAKENFKNGQERGVQWGKAVRGPGRSPGRGSPLRGKKKKKRKKEKKKRDGKQKESPLVEQKPDGLADKDMDQETSGSFRKRENVRQS